MPLDHQKIKHWPFPPLVRTYSRDDLVRSAVGFGAGLPGPLQATDARFLGAAADPLPMAAVALADGDFWQADPAAGLHWQQIVHAEEGITVHRALPAQGTVLVKRRIDEIYDRGPEKGAMVVEEQTLSTPDAELLASIRVITVLKRDGGFGGSSDGAPKPVPVPGDRPADESLTLASPRAADQPAFLLSGEFDVTATARGAVAGQRMLRGLAAFGLAGRAVMQLACGNEPARLRKLVVRYAGPLLTDEQVRVDLWHGPPGKAAFQMRSISRDVPVLQHCHAEFDPGAR